MASIDQFIARIIPLTAQSTDNANYAAIDPVDFQRVLVKITPGSISPTAISVMLALAADGTTWLFL